MSTPDTDDSDDSDAIQLHTRVLDRLEVGKPVVVHYQSNRGNKGRKTKAGEIINVQALGSGRYRFRFYDPDAERKIEVTLRETLDKSGVRSKKTTNWSVVGKPVQVLLSPTAENTEDVKQELVIAKRNGDFDVVIASAGISAHQRIIKWFAQNNYL